MDDDLQVGEMLSNEEHHNYRSVVGSLIYLVTKSSSGLARIETVLGSHITAPRQTDMLLAKRALRMQNTVKQKMLILKPEASNQIRAHEMPVVDYLRNVADGVSRE